MDFSELTTQGRWIPPAMRELSGKLAGYPYAFDLLIVFGALVVGFAIAWLVRRGLVWFGMRMYAKKADADGEVRGEIVGITTPLAWMLPVYAVLTWCWVEGMHVWIVRTLTRLGFAAISILAAMALVHAVNLLGIWYRRKLSSANRPIDGILATVRAFIVAAGAICALSALIGKSPLYLLSALGAAAAVLMIVFQGSLLSLAASIQVNSNRLVNIGDWIVLPGKDVDGAVEALTLHTVKVRNWDQTVVSLPVRTLVDQPFVNMSRMEDSGGRRYCREFLIDQRSVRFLRQDELESLRRFDLLYEAPEAIRGRGVADVKPHGPTFSGTRHQTNLGAFRAYLENYLKSHPLICQDLTLLVTVLAPTSSGVPLQVYAFTNQTAYEDYSHVAADITEHVLAVLPSFRLRMFQDASDIYQSIGEQTETVDGLFQYERFVAPGPKFTA